MASGAASSYDMPAAGPTDGTTGCVVVGAELFMMQGTRSAGGGGSSNRRPAADSSNNDVFIVDSGASVHATGNRSLFTDDILQPPEEGATAAATCRRVICVANGSALPIDGCGTVRRHNITLHGVLYVPGLAKNIVSVSKLRELDYDVEFRGTSCFIREARTGDIVGKGHLADGLYELDFLKAPPAA